MRSYNFAPRKERLILAHLGRGWRGFREVVTFLSGERGMDIAGKGRKPDGE